MLPPALLERKNDRSEGRTLVARGPQRIFRFHALWVQIVIEVGDRSSRVSPEERVQTSGSRLTIHLSLVLPLVGQVTIFTQDVLF